MIKVDEELRCAINAREHILNIIGDIKDSPSFAMPDHSPNKSTKLRLQDSLKDFEIGLIKLGAVPITAHEPCNDPHHEERAVWNAGNGSVGYWRYVLDDGRTDLDLLVGDSLIVDNTAMETDFSNLTVRLKVVVTPCPCNPTKTDVEHAICRYFIWPAVADSRLGELCETTLLVREAIALSNDGRRRSGVREKLLEAVLTLERLIVPETASEHIRRRGFS